MKINTKELDILVLNASILQLVQYFEASYPCSACEFVATRADILKRHIENKHEGVIYPCHECEYAATTTGALKIHVQNKHEKVRYPCS